MPRQIRRGEEPVEIGRLVHVQNHSRPCLNRHPTVADCLLRCLQGFRPGPGDAVKHSRVHLAASDRVVSAIAGWAERDVRH